MIDFFLKKLFHVCFTITSLCVIYALLKKTWHIEFFLSFYFVFSDLFVNFAEERHRLSNLELNWIKLKYEIYYNNNQL